MRIRLTLIAMAITTTSAAQSIPINPDVKPETIRATICKPGWTKTVRPSTSYTNSIKLHQLYQTGLQSLDGSKYELDHVVPLALGGAPRDPNNLKLQLWPEAKIKDKVEACLSRAVCRGAITLDKARNQIWNDWRATFCGKK